MHFLLYFNMPRYCGGVPKSTNMRYVDFSRLIELSNVELVCYTGYTPATLQNLLHIGIVLLGRYFIPVTNCSKLLHIVTYWDIPAGWVCHCCHCIMGYNVLYFWKVFKRQFLSKIPKYKYKITKKL